MANPGNPPRRSKLAKGLLIVCFLTLLSSLFLSVFSALTSQYDTVLDSGEIAVIQLDEPDEHAPRAVVHTTAGDLTFVLYPQECPQTVANFIALAESGAYDDTYVFRVEQNVFFSAGAADLSGAAADPDAACEHIPQELSPKLWPLRGALCALTTSVEGGFWKTLTRTQETFTGSRFLVADSIEMTDDLKAELLEAGRDSMQPVAEAFAEHGGIPNYSQQITVFGQLTEGFDVLSAVTGAELTGSEGAMLPKEEIRITSVEIVNGTV